LDAGKARPPRRLQQPPRRVWFSRMVQPESRVTGRTAQRSRLGIGYAGNRFRGQWQHDGGSNRSGRLGVDRRRPGIGMARPSSYQLGEEQMAIGSRVVQRFALVVVAGILAVTLTACTGRGGGYLPPSEPVFFGQASFGFQFSCEDKGGVNSSTGQLRIELAYNDHGHNPLGAAFSIHGIVDMIDPVWESMICIGQEPPLDGNELIFLGRYRLTSSPPSGFPAECPTREKKGTPLCRFEVIVRDNDGDLGPSAGDFFSIKLSRATVATSEPDPLTVFYSRAGLLQGGNITVR
jgi:hypothetical protein